MNLRLYISMIRPHSRQRLLKKLQIVPMQIPYWILRLMKKSLIARLIL